MTSPPLPSFVRDRSPAPPPGPCGVLPGAPPAGSRPASRRGILATLREREERAAEALRECRLCPRECGANRLAGSRGYCGAGESARVAAVSVHPGEEPPISGTRGSGTVFFSHCNLRCRFCQNWPISQRGVGRPMPSGELAERLLRLQARGVHNVHFVTPTPHIPHLIGAVRAARERGLSIPVVYNTNGYDSLAGLRLLDRVVDIYLPDLKYLDPALGEAYSGIPDYPRRALAAVDEMVRQVGPLRLRRDGIATRGVLIRHLVLPGRGRETVRVLRRVRERFGAGMPLSLMGQYFPAWEAVGDSRLGRRLTSREYGAAVRAAVRLAMERVYIQEISCPSEPT